VIAPPRRPVILPQRHGLLPAMARIGCDGEGRERLMVMRRTSNKAAWWSRYPDLRAVTELRSTRRNDWRKSETADKLAQLGRMLRGQWRLRRFVRAARSAPGRPIVMIEPAADAVESVFREFQRLDAKPRAGVATDLVQQNREARPNG
jgi:hypothetical protein